MFDNRRVLHGRTAFEDKSAEEDVVGKEPSRWLKGCYFEDDMMASHGRVLRPSGKLVDSVDKLRLK